MLLHRCFLLVFLLFSLTACEDQALYDIHDHKVELRSDQAVVVTYWAAWCAMCKSNIPVLNQLQLDRHNQVRILAFDIDEASNEAQQSVMEAFHVEYAFLRKGQHLVQAPVPEHIPTTYILAPGDHHLHATFTGALSLEALEKIIDTIEGA